MERSKSSHLILLALPWISIGGLKLATVIGITRKFEKFLTILPFELGSIVDATSTWGFLLVIPVTSVLWSYLQLRNEPGEGNIWHPLIMLSLSISFAQLLAMGVVAVAANLVYHLF